jgi:hypothetical protein
MGLADLASKTSSWLQKNSPLHKMVGQATDEYIDTGSKKALGKVMAPFAVGAAIPAALYAGAAGGLSSLAAGAARVGSAAKNAMPSRLSQLAQGPVKTVSKAAAGAGAAGGVGYGLYKVATSGKSTSSENPGDNQGDGGYTPKNDRSGDIDRLLSGGKSNAKSSTSGKSGKNSISESEKAQREISKRIGMDWDEMGDELGRIKGEVGGYATELTGKLSDIRASYLSAIDENKRQNDEAISGHRQLVEKSRKEELGKISDEAQKAYFQQNLKLGASNAGDSSAALMAQKGIQKQTERSRRQILDQVGVSLAELDQKTKEVDLTAKSQREAVYEREKYLKEMALETFNDSMAALKRLSEKSSGWKKKDIERASEENLQKLINSLNTISTQARSMRDVIHSEHQGILSEIATLRQQAALTFAPAEFEADKIDPGSTIDTGEDEEDFFNPDAPDRKRISKVKNILEQLDAEDAAGVTA